MKKSVFRIVGFIVLLSVVLCRVNNIFSFKYSDGISTLSHFYDLEKNSVDVLVLGSSHSFVNFNNGTLYEEYGIASYDLGGSLQPMWNSYYDLKEALKTQTPELIVLEGYGTTYDFEYSDDSRVIKNTYGMKWSLNKLEDIMVSSEPDRKLEFILDYSQYHNRYSSLEKGDFMDDYGSQNMNYNWYGDAWKGQVLLNSANSQEFMDVSSVDYETELLPKTEKYYRKTIELAQENNIPIIVVVAPYGLSEYEQSKYNKAEEIADEYGVDFLNCNLCLDDIGLNLNTDYMDNSHMTAIGTKVFSEYIGAYLKENFEISDRRGDEKYSSWQDYADYVNRYIADSEILSTYSVDQLLSFLNSSNYWVMISVDGNCNASDPCIQAFLNNIGIYTDVNGIWLKQNGSVIWGEGVESRSQYIRTEYKDFCVRHNSETGSNEIIIDNSQIKKVENGFIIVVYDPDLNIIIDVIGINIDDEYSFVR